VAEVALSVAQIFDRILVAYELATVGARPKAKILLFEISVRGSSGLPRAR